MLSGGRTDAEAYRAICSHIETIDIAAPSDWTSALPRVRSWLELDSILLYSVRDRSAGWRVERWDGDGKALDAGPLVRRLFERSSAFPLYYNPLAPVPVHRNRLVEALAWIDAHAPGTWETSPMCREVLAPLGAARWYQPRALLCDGPALVAWFGALTEQPIDRRQTRWLRALIEPVRRRVIAERLLCDGPVVRAAFEVMLDRIGCAAFLVDACGRVLAANHSGETRLAQRRDDVLTALADAVRGRPSSPSVELIPVASDGVPAHAIAVVGADGGSARLAHCVATCSRRWGLTPRQRDVLELVTRGLANATIAAALQCVERTVELHVTALLDRAGVDSRAALVSQVLTSV